MGWQDDPVVDTQPAWMKDPVVPATRGGLSKTPFNAPDLEGMGYKLGQRVTDFAAPHVPPEVAGGLGYLANVATQAIPTLIGGAVGSKVGESAGERLMRMSLKPSPTLGPRKTAEAVKTMLTADVGNVLPGANVTAGGIAQLQGKSNALGQAVDQLGVNSPEIINKYQIAKALRDVENQYGPANSAAPISDLSALSSLKKEFLGTHQNMSVSDALRLKEGIYKNIGEKAYKGTELKAAETTGQQALAKALRLASEKAVPEIAPLNAERSQLINAVKAAISRDAIAGNKDPIGIGALASNPAAAAAFMANRSEVIKSLLARLLYSGGGAAGATAGALYGNQQGQEP